MKKRIIFKLCVFVLGGAVVNVAVALVPSLQDRCRSNKMATVDAFDDEVGERVDCASWKGFGWSSVAVFRPAQRIIDSSTLPTLRGVLPWWVQKEEVSPRYGRDLVAFDAGGWPALALRGELRNRSAGGYEFRNGWELPRKSPLDRVRILPLKPLWPGFAINTIFYAAMLWLLFAAPGFVKRRIRVIRGRCRACGYDLRNRNPDSTCCPECGATI